VIRAGELVFVDTGAFIAAAVVVDKHHEEAAAIWDELLAKGARPVTSVPVVIETFTYL
jgi:predicted nucleic acid-binding protein